MELIICPLDLKVLFLFLIVRTRIFCIVLYCDMVPAANAPGCTAAENLLYKPWSFFSRSYFHRQVSLP